MCGVWRWSRSKPTSMMMTIVSKKMLYLSYICSWSRRHLISWFSFPAFFNTGAESFSLALSSKPKGASSLSNLSWRGPCSASTIKLRLEDILVAWRTKPQCCESTRVKRRHLWSLHSQADSNIHAHAHTHIQHLCGIQRYLFLMDGAFCQLVCKVLGAKGSHPLKKAFCETCS